MKYIENFIDVKNLDALWMQRLLRRLHWKIIIKAYYYSEVEIVKNLLINLSQKGVSKYLRKNYKAKVTEQQCKKAQEKIVKIFNKMSEEYENRKK